MWSVESLALVFIVAAILIAVLYSIAWYASIPSQLPPGPLGLPLVGCLPYIQSTTSHLTLEKWKEKYGNIMSFYMGSTLVVVLANYETMREALIKQGEIFNGRNVIRAFRPEGLVEGLGITGAEGDLWREQRAFCLKTLKDFGVGRSILEPKIRAEVHFLVDAIAESKGQPIDLQMLFHYAVSNIIVQMVFGKRYDYDDPVYVRYLETLSFRLSNSGVNALSTINFFPRIVALQSSSSAKTVVEESRLILDFIRQFIREKEANLDLDAEATDYMSAFLKAQKNGEGNYFFEDQLVIAVQQLFIAGTETTSTGLRWVIWYMATYPEYQEKVYKEIVETVGTEQLPLWADHSRMPFTEATICEVMRLATLAPLSITHRTTEDTTLMGYRIPKDSYVIPCLYTVHTDPAHFHQPRLFRPERFIDDKGQFVRHPAVLPFSAGKRTCLGESLARVEMFTYVTSLLQRFRFRFPDDVPRSAECPTVVGVIISPAPFKIIAEHRM